MACRWRPGRPWGSGHWTEAERILVWVKNTRTGRTACLRPTPALMDLLAAFKPQPKAGADGAKVDDARLEGGTAAFRAEGV